MTVGTKNTSDLPRLASLDRGHRGTVPAGEEEAITGKENPSKEDASHLKVNGRLNREEVSLLVSSKACWGLSSCQAAGLVFGLAEHPQPNCLDFIKEKKGGGGVISFRAAESNR